MLCEFGFPMCKLTEKTMIFTNEKFKGFVLNEIMFIFAALNGQKGVPNRNCTSVF